MTHAHFTFYVHVSNLTTTINSTCSTSESTKTGHFIMQYWKNFLARGHSPLSRPLPRWGWGHPLGACGASILAPAALDLGAFGASCPPKWNFWIHPCTVPRTDVDGFSLSSIGLEAATDDGSSGADMLDDKLASTNSCSNTAQHALCKQNNCTKTTDVN